MSKSTNYNSFVGWKDKYFPELIKEERHEKLRKDSGQLAIALANDTFASLQTKKRKRSKRQMQPTTSPRRQNLECSAPQ